MFHVGEVFPEARSFKNYRGPVCSHLNLGRKGTSSSKDKKLNWTVEARWNDQLKKIPQQEFSVKNISLRKNIGFEAIYTRETGSMNLSSYCKSSPLGSEHGKN